jgi:hypothetical protein
VVLGTEVLAGDRDAVRLDLALASLGAGSNGRWIVNQAGGERRALATTRIASEMGRCASAFMGASCRVESPFDLCRGLALDQPSRGVSVQRCA